MTHAVLAFGRMNPPTTGHEKFIKKTHDVAKKVGGTAHVVASHSEGDSKNPIPQKKKLEYIKKIAHKDVHVSGSSKQHPSILHHAAKLHAAGHQHLHVVAAGKREKEFHSLLHKYNGKKSSHGHYHFKSITVHSAGKRDPDSHDHSEGVSGTSMRQHAHDNNHKEFKKGLPKALHPHKEEIMGHIKSIKEEVELHELGFQASKSTHRLDIEDRERKRTSQLKRFAASDKKAVKSGPAAQGSKEARLKKLRLAAAANKNPGDRDPKKTTKDTTKHERAAINSIHHELNRVKEKTGKDHVVLHHNGKEHHITKISNVKGNPKADSKLHDKHGNHIYLSHKADGGGWGHDGTNASHSKNHPKVKELVKHIDDHHGGTHPTGARHVNLDNKKHESLIKKAKFGKDHGTGKPHGNDNVHSVVTGKPSLKKNNVGGHELTSSKIEHHDEPLKDKHVVYSRKLNGNTDHGLKNTRLHIASDHQGAAKKSIHISTEGKSKMNEDLDQGFEDLIEALNVVQRIKRKLIMRRIRPKINRAKRLFKHRKVPEKNLQQRARKAGIRFVRKRVAGKKGTQYTKLSAAAKMHIDKKVSKQQKIVTNIARRLLPRTRKSELVRLQRNELEQDFADYLKERTNATTRQDGKPFEKENNPTVAAKTKHKYKEKNEKGGRAAPVTEQDLQALYLKATKGEYPFETILEVFVRGIEDWDGGGNSPAQYAFNRVNSFVAGGKAYEMDGDLVEASSKHAADQTSQRDRKIGRKSDALRSKQSVSTSSTTLFKRRHGGKTSQHRKGTDATVGRSSSAETTGNTRRPTGGIKKAHRDLTKYSEVDFRRVHGLSKSAMRQRLAKENFAMSTGSAGHAQSDTTPAPRVKKKKVLEWGTDEATAHAKNMTPGEVNELSTKTLASYHLKSQGDSLKTTKKYDKKAGTKDEDPYVDHLYNKKDSHRVNKRFEGGERAEKKLKKKANYADPVKNPSSVGRSGAFDASVHHGMKKSQMNSFEPEGNTIDEISRETLGSYQSKASDARGHRTLSTKKVDNRYAGVKKASDRLDASNKGKSFLQGFTDRRNKGIKSKPIDKDKFFGKKKVKEGLTGGAGGSGTPVVGIAGVADKRGKKKVEEKMGFDTHTDVVANTKAASKKPKRGKDETPLPSVVHEESDDHHATVTYHKGTYSMPGKNDGDYHKVDKKIPLKKVDTAKGFSRTSQSTGIEAKKHEIHKKMEKDGYSIHSVSHPNRAKHYRSASGRTDTRYESVNLKFSEWLTEYEKQNNEQYTGKIPPWRAPNSGREGMSRKKLVKSMIQQKSDRDKRIQDRMSKKAKVADTRKTS